MIRISLLFLLAASFLNAGELAFHVSAVFSEKMITLKWADIPDISVYDVYAMYDYSGFFRANPVPIATRNQFSFLWVDDGSGEKKRIVKGNAVSLYISALRGEGCADQTSPCEEAGRSVTIQTRYFDGFNNIVSGEKCLSVMRESQETQPVMEKLRGISTRRFHKEYHKLAFSIDSVYRENINPKDEGACVPMSTMVAKYFSSNGVPCFRCEGQFISEYHNFNLIIVDDVEYILDFTADQFIPGSTPVLIPRDYCHIDSLGYPTNMPQGTFTSMYAIARIFDPERISFSNTEKALEYKRILDDLLKE